MGNQFTLGPMAQATPASMIKDFSSCMIYFIKVIWYNFIHMTCLIVAIAFSILKNLPEKHLCSPIHFVNT
jgi:hypothetical protein